MEISRAAKSSKSPRRELTSAHNTFSVPLYKHIHRNSRRVFLSGCLYVMQGPSKHSSTLPARLASFKPLKLNLCKSAINETGHRTVLRCNMSEPFIGMVNGIVNRKSTIGIETMNLSQTLSTLFLLLLVALVSCDQAAELGSGDLPGDVTRSDQLAKSVNPDIVYANNRFSLKLLQKANEASVNQDNLFLSGLSVSAATLMLSNGATGTTQQELLDALEMNGRSMEEINEAYTNLIASLIQIDGSIRLDLANSAWFKENFAVKEPFQTVLEDTYRAGVDRFGEDLDAAKERMNRWVEQHTNGQIKQFITSLRPLDLMVLINAIYFQADWTYQFDAEKTYPNSFTDASGQTHQVPMMYGDEIADTLSYGTFDDVDVARLPFGSERVAAYIFLPHTTSSVEQLIRDLDMAYWESLTGNFFSGDTFDRVHLSVPKVSFTATTNLLPLFQDMGVSKAFIPEEADFSGITDERFFVNQMFQKSMLRLNEEGGEAAAASGIVAGTTNIDPDANILNFIVNRPYLVSIVDERNGSILFIGKIGLPKYDE